MVWETLPVIYADGSVDQPDEAIWPFLPVYSEGKLPMNQEILANIQNIFNLTCNLHGGSRRTRLGTRARTQKTR